MPSVWHEKRGRNYRVFWYTFQKADKKSMVVGASLDDVLEFEQKKWRQVRREAAGLPPLPGDETAEQIKVAAFLDKYVADRRSERSAHTVDNFDKPAAETLKAFAGDKYLSQLTTKDAHDYKVWLLTQAKHKRGTGYHANTVRMYLRAIRTAFSHAVNMKQIAANPFTAVPLPPAVVVGRVSPDGELAKILEHASPRLAELIYFLVHQGCRRGDAENLSYDAGCFEVLPTGRWRFTIQGDKTKNRRDKLIVLHKESQALLIAMGGPKPGGSVFTLTRNEIDWHWRDAKERAGITSRLRLHDLKVKFINSGLDSGMSPARLREFTGNLSESSFNSYVKQGQGAGHEQMDQISFELPQVISPSARPFLNLLLTSLLLILNNTAQ